MKSNRWRRLSGNSRSRWLPCIIALILAIFFLSSAYAGDDNAGGKPMPATQVIKFIPKVPATEQKGDCWTSSASIDRADAWRCRVQNSIYDPCFIGRDGKTVVCDAEPPDEKDAFRLRLTAPLPKSTGSKEPKGAWLLQLTDGTMCRFVTGATGGINDQRMNYFCGPESEGIDTLIGDPVIEGKTWTIERWRGKTLPMDGNTQGNPPKKVYIMKAWQ
ncbi:MAG: hypothetical protein HQK55_17505 [Deltaproteobacteria bacterium]|nr:hypothetical protein [Deltaproteobacteria bacterium]